MQDVETRHLASISQKLVETKKPNPKGIWLWLLSVLNIFSKLISGRKLLSNRTQSKHMLSYFFKSGQILIRPIHIYIRANLWRLAKEVQDVVIRAIGKIHPLVVRSTPIVLVVVGLKDDVTPTVVNHQVIRLVTKDTWDD